MLLRCVLCLMAWLAIPLTSYAADIILDNRTAYPQPDGTARMAVQWAASAREVDEGNAALLYGSPLPAGSLSKIAAPGKVSLLLPRKAEYFRVLVWSQGRREPDLHTNWVVVVPQKAYTLQGDHLVPCALMAGTGC